MTNWTHVKIPSTPTPNLIIVNNISEDASEKTVKDFFLFCGKILEFELQKEGDRQVALVLFERESAAKTACMLTNAMIVNSQISVKPYFEETVDANDHTAQENKPKVTVLAEILAAGYTLQDQIIEKGLEIDAKYCLVGRIQAYVEAAKAQAKNLDEKYHVTAKASELDHKYHVQDRVNAAVGQGIGYSNQALQTAPGQKVAGVATHVKEQIAAVHYEARRLADEKKNKAAASAPAAPTAPAAPAPATEAPIA
jgi:DNA gyrase/topoisomerase IV subunit B